MWRRSFRSRSDRVQNLVFAAVVGVGSGVYIFQQDQSRSGKAGAQKKEIEK